MPVHIKTINTTKKHIDTSSLASVVNPVLNSLPADRDWNVVIRLVTDRSMRLLNKTYLAQDYPTDVLSFPLHNFQQGFVSGLPAGPLLLGEVVVNLDQAARQAKQSGHSVVLEVQSLIVHGVRHLIGFHHE